MNGRLIVFVSICMLTLAGTAAGFTAGRVFQVRPGDSADFPGKNWRCNHYLRYIDCFTGDARPYVKLAIRNRCGCVALKVYNLRAAPHPTRTFEHGTDVVYTFVAG